MANDAGLMRRSVPVLLLRLRRPCVRCVDRRAGTRRYWYSAVSTSLASVKVPALLIACRPRTRRRVALRENQARDRNGRARLNRKDLLGAVSADRDTRVRGVRGRLSPRRALAFTPGPAMDTRFEIVIGVVENDLRACRQEQHDRVARIGGRRWQSAAIRRRCPRSCYTTGPSLTEGALLLPLRTLNTALPWSSFAPAPPAPL